MPSTSGDVIIFGSPDLIGSGNQSEKSPADHHTELELHGSRLWTVAERDFVVEKQPPRHTSSSTSPEEDEDGEVILGLISSSLKNFNAQLQKEQPSVTGASGQPYLTTAELFGNQHQQATKESLSPNDDPFHPVFGESFDLMMSAPWSLFDPCNSNIRTSNCSKVGFQSASPNQQSAVAKSSLPPHNIPTSDFVYSATSTSSSNCNPSGMFSLQPSVLPVPPGLPRLTEQLKINEASGVTGRKPRSISQTLPDSEVPSLWLTQYRLMNSETGMLSMDSGIDQEPTLSPNWFSSGGANSSSSPFSPESLGGKSSGFRMDEFFFKQFHPQSGGGCGGVGAFDLNNPLFYEALVKQAAGVSAAGGDSETLSMHLGGGGFGPTSWAPSLSSTADSSPSNGTPSQPSQPAFFRPGDNQQVKALTSRLEASFRQHQQQLQQQQQQQQHPRQVFNRRRSDSVPYGPTGFPNHQTNAGGLLPLSAATGAATGLRSSQVRPQSVGQLGPLPASPSLIGFGGCNYHHQFSRPRNQLHSLQDHSRQRQCVAPGFRQSGSMLGAPRPTGSPRVVSALDSGRPRRGNASSGTVATPGESSGSVSTSPPSSDASSESRPQLAKWRRACSFYLRGHCKKEDCEFAHDLTKVTCKFWETGECFKGSTCPFLHGYPPELFLDVSSCGSGVMEPTTITNTTSSTAGHLVTN